MIFQQKLPMEIRISGKTNTLSMSVGVWITEVLLMGNASAYM